MNQQLLKAIDAALAGKWDAAHLIVQRYDGEPMASWIHAVLHKIEGDQANSRYWYQRAEKLEHLSDVPKAELKAIKQQLAAE